MRFANDHVGARRGRWRHVAVVACSLAVGCAAQTAPTQVAAADSLYLGTWKGPITSTALGVGQATLVLDFGIKTPDGPLFSGNWQFVFPNSVYNTQGVVSAKPRTDGATLDVLFASTTLACPTTPVTTFGAALSVSGDTMRGSYSVFECSEGTLELTRQH